MLRVDNHKFWLNWVEIVLFTMQLVEDEVWKYGLGRSHSCTFQIASDSFPLISSSHLCTLYLERVLIAKTKIISLVRVLISLKAIALPNRNHGWYDFSKSTYDELVSDRTTYDSYCAILLGTPEMVFVLSQDDIKKIFDEQFMNKPDAILLFFTY